MWGFFLHIDKEESASEMSLIKLSMLPLCFELNADDNFRCLSFASSLSIEPYYLSDIF
jgi:hypothetical protein|tara:strand:+ start:691 stop:864 length:174 start_codon:yes stop_codon:yes gene_type:complete